MPHMSHTCSLERLFVCMVFLSLLFLTEMFDLLVISSQLSERKRVMCSNILRYRPHSDSQTEVINQSLENLVWYLMDESLTM